MASKIDFSALHTVHPIVLIIKLTENRSPPASLYGGEWLGSYVRGRQYCDEVNVIGFFRRLSTVSSDMHFTATGETTTLLFYS